MSSKHSRRTVLSSVGCLTGASILGVKTTEAAASSVTVEATVVYANGDPAVDDEIILRGNGNFNRYRTDKDGVFVGEVESQGYFRVGYYKKGDSQIELDGSPYLYDIGDAQVESNEAALGTFELPDAHHVDVQFLNEDGGPETRVDPTLRQSWGTGPSHFNIDDSGWLKRQYADFTGIELVGDITLELFDRQYSTEFTVQNDMKVVAVIDYETKQVLSLDITDTEDASTKTTEPTTDTEAKSNENTPTDDTPTTTEEPSSTETGTATETAGSTPSGNESSTQSTESDQAERGFFSNDVDTSRGYLEDPFFLTIAGFVLSIVGILSQMLRGN